MKSKIMLQGFVLVASVSIGLLGPARADDASNSPSNSSQAAGGLLGKSYWGLDYGYVHLENSPVSADRYGFVYNQPIRAGFDGIVSYDRTQAGLLAGDRAYGDSLDAIVRAFTSAYTWGKPYLEAGVGYDWTKIAGVHDHSVAWIAGTGVEFQATTALSITPFLRYTNTPDFMERNEVDYGVSANYWLTRHLGLTGAIDRDNSRDMSYKIGLNVHF